MKASLKQICLLASSLACTATAGACITIAYDAYRGGGHNSFSMVSQTKPSASSFTPFTHNYHSLNEYYRNRYYPDVTKENVRLIEPYRFTNPNYDYCTDRFNYLFYDDQTYVCIYHKDDNPISTSIYDTYSVNTSWQAADGFAYIVDDRNSNDGDAPTNTFFHVFGNDINLASYFDVNDNPNIYSDVCSYQAIENWVDKTISTDGALTIDLSTLLANDLERDNAVLSLLNPMLWDAILLGLSTKAASLGVETSIKTIDLSWNNLRVVPNIASIPNKNDNGWMFESTSDYSNVELQMNDMGSSQYAGWLTNGCIKNIDLSHNALTYFNLYSYRLFDEEYEWFPTDQTTSEYYIYSKEVNYPSLLTLCYCRYASLITSIYDYADTIPGIMGLNLDYNYLPYLVCPFLQYTDDGNGDIDLSAATQYNAFMIHSWGGIEIESLEDFDYSYARCYLTYTCNNYYDASNTTVNFAENLLGWGAYQYDALTSSEDECNHYLEYANQYSILSNTEKNALQLFKFSLFNKYQYATIAATRFGSDTSSLDKLNDLIRCFYIRTGLLSRTYEADVIVPSLIGERPSCCELKRITFDMYGVDSWGELLVQIFFAGFYRQGYLPSDIYISSDASYTTIFNSILGSITKNGTLLCSISGWDISYAYIVIVAIVYGFTLALICCFVLYFMFRNVVKKNKSK